jgi:hypothetical protein
VIAFARPINPNEFYISGINDNRHGNSLYADNLTCDEIILRCIL